MVARHHKITEAVIGIVLGVLAIAAIWTGIVAFMPSHNSAHPYIPEADAIHVPSGSLEAGADNAPGSRIASIPVISWHQMNNGCSPTAPLCTTPVFSTDNVTQRQFYDEISWLYSRGYRTVTASQYQQWATGQDVTLPSKPVLLTVDDGIVNFYAGATPVLRYFGYTMVSMVVSRFAQGASDGRGQYKGWDGTWTQLRNLPADVWEFAFHAGPRGHVVSADSQCQYFYPCQRPGESAAAYRARVASDINAGIAAERQNLGSRAATRMWAVPFNDLAQNPGQLQSGPGPAAWLGTYAAREFSVVFVDGVTTKANQHYRYEVHGIDTLQYFESQVQRGDLYTRISNPDVTSTGRAGGES